jgi:hypothetical protein
MLLQELPSKIGQRVQKSVTWAEVGSAAPRRTPLRRMLARFTRGARSAADFRAAVVRLCTRTRQL